MRIFRVTVTGLVALVGILLALEVAFRVGGLLVAEGPAPAPDGTSVILCVGDSHTRGRTDPENYPAQLQRLLNERAAGRWRVINVGVPGMNTAQVRTRLERYLAYYRPAIVLHWAGINNFWNRAERERTGILERLADGSKVLRLVRVTLFYRGLRYDPQIQPVIEGQGQTGTADFRIRVNFGGAEEEIRSVDTGKLSEEEVSVVTRDDLTDMMRLAREHHVPMYLIAYSYFFGGYYSPVNAAVEGVSAEFGVPPIKAGAAVPAATEEAHGEPLFDAWVHPTPVLYKHIAGEVFRVLLADGVVKPRDSPP